MKEHNYNAYMQNDPFLFASYSHADTPRVERILRILFRQGLRIWYDQRGEGIPVSENWRERIDERIAGSSAFLVFLSNGVEYRPEVLREIDQAIERSKRNPQYKMVFLFLERMPVTVFSEKIREKLKELQFIPLYKYGGITEQFVNRLLSRRLWSAELVDDTYRLEHGLKPWKEVRWDGQELGKVTEELSDLTESSGYIYQQAFPKATRKELAPGRTVEFYQVRKGELSPGTCYPICLDNQWCPPVLFNNHAFLERGLSDVSVEAQRQAIQKKDLFQALLHNRQIVVNRSMMFNTRVFIDWYRTNSPDHQALCSLLESGAIVVFLFTEEHPCQEKKDFDKIGFQYWVELCTRHRIYCLRLDWSSEENNSYECRRRLGDRFHAFCLTTVDNQARLDELEEMFGVSPEEREAFRSIWRSVQASTVNYSVNENKPYSREEFYRSYVIRQDTLVPDCILDETKPFAQILKQAIDLEYCFNLPRALDIQVQIASGMPGRNFALSDARGASAMREITASELSCAVLEFDPDFLWKNVPVPDTSELSLTQVLAMRKCTAWSTYMRCVDAGRKRSRLNEVDFSDIVAVWKSYANWLTQVERECPQLRCSMRPGAVCILFRLGGKELTVCYENEKPLVLVDEVQGRVGGNRVSITIDYVCGNLEGLRQNDCILTEIRLFEGFSLESGETVYNELMEALRRYKSGGRDGVYGVS